MTAVTPEPDGSFDNPFYCEREGCDNELDFADIQAGDGLCRDHGLVANYMADGHLS